MFLGGLANSLSLTKAANIQFVYEKIDTCFSLKDFLLSLNLVSFQFSNFPCGNCNARSWKLYLVISVFWPWIVIIPGCPNICMQRMNLSSERTTEVTWVGDRVETYSGKVTSAIQKPSFEDQMVSILYNRVASIVGPPPKLTSFWIISSNFLSNSPFPPSPAGRLQRLESPCPQQLHLLYTYYIKHHLLTTSKLFLLFHHLILVYFWRNINIVVVCDTRAALRWVVTESICITTAFIYYWASLVTLSFCPTKYTKV